MMWVIEGKKGKDSDDLVVGLIVGQKLDQNVPERMEGSRLAMVLILSWTL